MKQDSFKDFVADQLSEISELRIRSMFGGYGIYHCSYFFGIIYKGRLYFKTSEKTKEKYIEAKMEVFQPNSKMALRNYFEVPSEVLEDKLELQKWTEESIRANK